MSIQICHSCERQVDTDFEYMLDCTCESCCEDICDYYDENPSEYNSDVAKHFGIYPSTLKKILMEYK